MDIYPLLETANVEPLLNVPFRLNSSYKKMAWDHFSFFVVLEKVNNGKKTQTCSWLNTTLWVSISSGDINPATFSLGFQKCVIDFVNNHFSFSQDWSNRAPGCSHQTRSGILHFSAYSSQGSDWAARHFAVIELHSAPLWRLILSQGRWGGWMATGTQMVSLCRVIFPKALFTINVCGPCQTCTAAHLTIHKRRRVALNTVLSRCGRLIWFCSITETQQECTENHSYCEVNMKNMLGIYEYIFLFNLQKIKTIYHSASRSTSSTQSRPSRLKAVKLKSIKVLIFSNCFFNRSGGGWRGCISATDEEGRGKSSSGWMDYLHLSGRPSKCAKMR